MGRQKEMCVAEQGDGRVMMKPDNKWDEDTGSEKQCNQRYKKKR